MASNVAQGSARLILIGSAVLLSIGMGLRQSLGLFLTPVTRDLALTTADFHTDHRDPEYRLGLVASAGWSHRRPFRAARDAGGGNHNLYRRARGDGGCRR